MLLTSHLGRPKDGPEDKYRLAPVVDRLKELLGTDVMYAKDCIGADVPDMISKMSDGSVLVLENVRFYKVCATWPLDSPGALIIGRSPHGISSSDMRFSDMRIDRNKRSREPLLVAAPCSQRTTTPVR